jgi:hypothetical protein
MDGRTVTFAVGTSLPEEQVCWCVATAPARNAKGSFALALYNKFRDWSIGFGGVFFLRGLTNLKN